MFCQKIAGNSRGRLSKENVFSLSQASLGLFSRLRDKTSWGSTDSEGCRYVYGKQLYFPRMPDLNWSSLLEKTFPVLYEIKFSGLSSGSKSIKMMSTRVEIIDLHVCEIFLPIRSL